MSEQTQTPQFNPENPEELPLVDVQEIGFAERFRASVDNIGQRAESLVGRTVEASKVAFHGIGAVIERRKMRAGINRMEKMHHKSLLYSDLGRLATTGQRGAFGHGELEATGEVVMPRSILERTADKFIDRQKQKKDLAAVYSYRATKIFGPKEDLPGLDKFERKTLKRRVSKDNTLTAQEKRLQRNTIDAQPLKLGEKMHARTSAKHESAANQLDNALRILPPSKYRKKRDKAIGKVKSGYRNAGLHELALAEIRARQHEEAQDTEES